LSFNRGVIVVFLGAIRNLLKGTIHGIRTVQHRNLSGK